MNRATHFTWKLPAVTAISLIASALSSVVRAAPPVNETVTVRAGELQRKSEHYTELATFYRNLATPWSKWMIAYLTQANRADRLADRYRLAAAEESRRG